MCDRIWKSAYPPGESLQICPRAHSNCSKIPLFHLCLEDERELLAKNRTSQSTLPLWLGMHPSTSCPLYSGACLWHTTPQRKYLLHTSRYNYSVPPSSLATNGKKKGGDSPKCSARCNSWEAVTTELQIINPETFSLKTYVLYCTCGSEKDKKKPRAPWWVGKAGNPRN